MKKDISKKTREILKEHGLRLKKRYGQNFLTSPYVLDDIVRFAELTPRSGVIEIGPGIGALTQKLSEVAGKVVAIEIDQDLIPVLSHLFMDDPRVVIRAGDVLKIDLMHVIKEHLQEVEDIHVVANLPYYITTPILTHLLESKYLLQSLVMMVQKEVAERLCASPGTKAYGSITVFASYYAEVEKVISVSKTNFFPEPKVDSSVVRFKMRNTPPVKVSDEEFFFRVVRASFAQRRKTLLNCLSGYAENGNKEEIKKKLLDVGIDPSRRGETLSLEEFALLSESLR